MHKTEPKLLRAYGDREGDGMVQMSFTLAMPKSARAKEAALEAELERQQQQLDRACRAGTIVAVGADDACLMLADDDVGQIARAGPVRLPPNRFKRRGLQFAAEQRAGARPCDPEADRAGGVWAGDEDVAEEFAHGRRIERAPRRRGGLAPAGVPIGEEGAARGVFHVGSCLREPLAGCFARAPEMDGLSQIRTGRRAGSGYMPAWSMAHANPPSAAAAATRRR